MRAVDVVQKKRDGGELTREEIDFFISGYARGDIPDYQASAFAMAVFFRGMTPAEIVALTESMMRTGEVLDLSDLPGPKVDKHSTGGVGDKTSLVLAPLAAACGVYVPMISGRGLGHTGGTLDKLESIPGFNVRLSLDRAARGPARLRPRASSARPRRSPPPTASSTRCATSPPPSRACPSSPPRS